ncbi:unnamed protein product [Brassicogethes aeneus]|uniref:C2H2-type domain-containing protein n=1 Tax=Brassicogethes aeneus TaxID=1431903 RepID=A0A9P0FDS5_BRAAE|nr:unnamed protein product [Brassicogethes aeneus]
MEQTIVKEEPEELVDDFKNNILMNCNNPSTCTDQEMPSISGIAIKQEIKEELDEDEALLEKGSEIIESDEDNSDHGDKIEPFFCNVKEEGRGSDFFEEEDQNLSDNEEKDEDEAMLETKIEVEYHGVDFEDISGKGKFFKCDFCPKMYKSKTCLCRHKKYIHLKGKQERFKCGKCDYESAYKSSLNRHIKIHDIKNKLKCHFCQFLTAELRSLHAHVLSKHKLENEEKEKIKILGKIHQCPECSYSTVYKSAYDNHIKVCLKLENVEWYNCHICHYKTIHKRHLDSHVKTHNKIKEFKCVFCKYCSNKKFDLDNHILRKHPDLFNESNRNLITSKMHCCQTCNYKTTYASHLKKHLNRNH